MGKFSPIFIKRFDLALIDLLWAISGERITDDLIRRILDTHKRLKEKADQKSIVGVEYVERQMMDFFGYKAKRWSVVVYALLHLFLFGIIFFRGAQIPVM